MRIISAGARVVLTGLWIATVCAAATGSSPTTEPAASADTTAGRPGAKPAYVAGEVIVKLRDIPGGQGRASSDDAVLRNDQATLSRLQVMYGLQTRGPVFQRVHEQWRSGASRGRLGAATALDSGLAQRQARDILRCYVLKTSRHVEALCAELRRDPQVEYAQPNYIYTPCKTPNDPEFPDQYAHQLIEMEKAWEISTGSREVVVALIGTGVDVNHPDLKENIWVNPREIAGNKIDDDNNGFVDDIHGWSFFTSSGIVTPWHEHETEVAGVIAGVGNNGKGICGVNWQCSIMVLQLGYDYASAEVAAALDYAAANGARIVNMSFGGDVFGPQGDPVVKTAIDNAYERGVLLVASAGNSDTSRTHYPAAYPNVMAVASTNGEDTKTGHSTFGLWVDIAAPGTDIVTTDLNDEYVSTAGTSFSAPYVAGVAALLFARQPSLTHMEARAILEDTTDPLYYGDVDPNLAYLGTGRVNAYKALLAVDEALPLGEIFAPMANQVLAADGNDIPVRLYVHGDSYRLDYRLYGQPDWTLISTGGTAPDPNGFVTLSLANPGPGTYEMCLHVTLGDNVRTDSGLFTVTAAANQAHWPAPQGATEEDLYYLWFRGSPICMDVDGNGRNEIIEPLIDYYSYSGSVNVWTEDGNSLPHWPVNTGYYWPTSTAVGDIDGDGDYEVIAGCELDGAVLAFHVESGQLVSGRWPASVGGWYGYISAGPVLADLDGDGDSEIIVALDMESTDTDGLIALQGDGNPLWQRRYTSIGPISVADMNRDGRVEIALGGLGPGLSRPYTFILDNQGQQIARWRGGSPKGTAIGDIDHDGKTEMVFCTEQEVTAVRMDGSTVWKTRTADPLDTAGGLCIADLDGDGYSEVYVTTLVPTDEGEGGDGFQFTHVYAFDYKGRLLTAADYPKTIMGDPARCIPLVADIDGDGQKDLIVGLAGEPFMAWKADGTITRGFPMLNLAPDVEMTAVLEDLDQDGDLEIMVPADDYRFYVVDLPTTYSAPLVDWGMSRHDPQNSGWTAAPPRLESMSAPAQVRPGERLQVTLTASNPANLPLRWSVGNLPEGAWYDPQSLTLFWKPTIDQAFETCTFSFLVTDGVRQASRSMSVAVVPDAIYYASMDADPNWILDEGWVWGAPTGKGSWNHDPTAGRTGQNVMGYALDGDYANDVAQTRYATVGPIDCRGNKNICLSFWRWLGVESPYDYACVQVSNDGATWTNLWTTGQFHVSDSDWQFVEYAIPPEIGDGRPTLFFRWGMGPTDDVVTYPGWNIDDVQVTGDPI
jgi:subtilisin family serine protease